MQHNWSFLPDVKVSCSSYNVVAHLQRFSSQKKTSCQSRKWSKEVDPCQKCFALDCWDRPLISRQSLFTCQELKAFPPNEPQLCWANTEDSLVWGRLWLSMTVISLCQSSQWIPLCPIYRFQSEMQWRICRQVRVLYTQKLILFLWQTYTWKSMKKSTWNVCERKLEHPCNLPPLTPDATFWHSRSSL